ncbi:AurF N-oxygenase family protein [Nocardia sp. 004]|uniref:AurF N-oxygenase family protein n=1 Tax=Nocardia sp. 004 TaxID=3385978 RepID=UPI0039A01BE6
MARSMKPITTAASPVSDPDLERAQKYAETVMLLSEASVHKHFDPYMDIDWDNPDFAVDAGPERWILPPSADPMGRHPWYQSLPIEQKIAIGKYRYAQVLKVGLQFECILISGMTLYNFRLPIGSPEFRYCSHEMIEEHNHNLMFYEMINRIGMDVPGIARFYSKLRSLGAILGAYFPNLFFLFVIGGEEPIDNMQKKTLRSGDAMHPMTRGVVAIHVAEEARHISFAHEYMRNRVPRLNVVHRFVLSLIAPICLMLVGRMLTTPPRAFFAQFHVPYRVRRNLYYHSPDARNTFRGYFDDVRTLAGDIGLMNPVAKAIWKLLRIYGPPARYRSEPSRTANMAA